MSTEVTLFESYEQDYSALLASIQSKLAAASSQPIEQRKASLRRAELDMDEADDMLSHLEELLAHIPQTQRAKPALVSRVRAAKTNLAACKKQSRELYHGATRAELLPRYNSGRGGDFAEPDERTRLLAGHQTLADGSTRLEDSTRVALRTEEVGAEILRNLRRQREQIVHAGDTLHTADTNIDRSSGIMKRMIRQMYRQRVIFALIGVFFLALISIILYFKLRR
ncbi:hypothetical protein HDZ31DRAFT_64455 [Schizophyllum fasciatum]